jgi:3-hydroxyisobutyrate dehydrogenase
MVGGQPEDFQTIQPILAHMGKSIVHAGPNGAGLSAKICNNLLLAIRCDEQIRTIHKYIDEIAHL